MSVAILAATNSEPKVAVSTVDCLLVSQWEGVAFTMCKHAVTANREKLKAHTKGTTGNTMMENSLLCAPC